MSYAYPLIKVRRGEHKGRTGGRGGELPFVWADEHIVIAERALRKTLPKGAEVHHFDGNKKNNAHQNLVVCQDRAYHELLHLRQRAKAGCGNPNWRRCKRCKVWSPPGDLYFFKRNDRKNGFECVHPLCHAKYQRDRKARLRAAGAA